MIRHYLTFAHQAALLHDLLVGRPEGGAPALAECWSQEKNRVLLHFVESGEPILVEIAIDLRVGYALPRDGVRRARKNTIDLFPSLLGARVSDVTIDDGERAIRFNFADGRQLVAFFFGRGAGNLLLVEDERIVAAFRKESGEYDAALAGTTEEKMHGREEIARALVASDATVERALARILPELGRRLATEAIHRAGVDPGLPAREVTPEALGSILQQVDAVYAECESTIRFYLYYLEEELVLALTTLRSLEGKATRVEEFTDIARAIRAYRSAYYRVTGLETLRGRMEKRITSELHRLERRLVNGEKGAEEGRAEEWERNASLLLAHLHELKRGEKEATLVDWEGNERTIQLDPKMTPAQNAERYFKRARGAREAAVQWKARREQTLVELDRLETIRAELQRATTIEELEKMESTHTGALKMDANEPKEEGTAERFRRFEVSGGHEVYVGKNAANNDELTVRFARPNDYWFHARGSSGSHVVLRWGDSKSKPPREALRDAASIAAYYSGARNARMVPVAYTLKKYVRKPKGSAVGAVVMDREEVVMVEPKIPGGS
jgi:predicted ribosome quality control (RQC) complex YloA/Tae2 family protein